MQLASHGAWAAARKAPQAARNIHIPPGIRPQGTSLAQKLFAHTRLAVSRFVTHLTTPGVGNTVSVARSYHAANPSIQQRLSFTARQALARPLHTTFLPRAPVVPRSVAQVGLGTARNFSTGRPIFQHLIENVPVAGRALYEVDWDLKMRQEMENMRLPAKNKAHKTKKSKELLKSTQKPVVAVSTDAEMDHYFAAPAVPDVTTYLLIPLAPTPTERAPLPEFPAGRLPLGTLLDIHDSHETHSLRVSSLFQRLDAADVWSRGAQCAAYTSSADPRGRGVASFLKVEFAGWTKAAVRGVIGESGTGWCVLEERHGSARLEDEFVEPEDDEDLSDTSSILSGIGLESPPQEPEPETIDPAHSFVLPTLDFSSSFLAATRADAWSPPAPVRDLFEHPNSSGSDVGSWSDAVSSVVFVDPPSENGWFEAHSARGGSDNPWLESASDLESGSGFLFSSDFARRQAEAGAREPLESPFA